MNSNRKLTRRRFLRIAGFAGVSAASMSPLTDCLAGDAPASAWTWRGVVLGADASISIHGLPQKEASRLTMACFDEVRRFEKMFSLHDPNSTLCQLNCKGQLCDPPAEFVELLKQTRRFSEATQGVFDVTIQSLWSCYRDHYEHNPEAPLPDDDLQKALAKVDYRKLQISKRRVAFNQPGMAITLNGIAQGWITDRIVDFLRCEGVTSTLVNMGEYRALGRHPEDRPWQLGVRSPQDSEQIIDVVPLENAALAVSGGYGHPFAGEAQPHHLLHPKTGMSQPANRTIALVAPTATEADALSTACAVVGDTQARSFAQDHSVVMKIHG